MLGTKRRDDCGATRSLHLTSHDGELVSRRTAASINMYTVARLCVAARFSGARRRTVDAWIRTQFAREAVADRHGGWYTWDERTTTGAVCPAMSATGTPELEMTLRRVSAQGRVAHSARIRFFRYVISSVFVSLP